MQVDISGRSVLVVGAGAAGLEKVRRLRAAGAQVTVVDPAPVAQRIRDVAEVLHRPFQAADVERRWLVVAATNSAEVNEEVETAALAAGVWVNRADRPDGGQAAFAASLSRGRVEVAVSSGGASPTLSRWVRDTIDAALPEELATIADLFAAARASGRPRSHRGVSIDDLVEAVQSGDLLTARRLVGLGE